MTFSICQVIHFLILYKYADRYDLADPDDEVDSKTLTEMDTPLAAKIKTNSKKSRRASLP